MDGSKRILVFSDAGGTGRSYHADLSVRNQARRVHFLLEPGWKADAAIQGLVAPTAQIRLLRPCSGRSRPTFAANAGSSRRLPGGLTALVR